VSLAVTRPCAMMPAMPAGSASLIFNDGLERPLTGDLTIGRDEQNDLVLITKSVSREHARIVCEDERWYVEDRGSFNGTLLNGQRIQPGARLPLRHADRLQLGSQVILFSHPALADDPNRTDPGSEPAVTRPLSPLQLQIVRCLCESWLGGGTLDQLPSNEEIAARLGTPGAVGTVKAALRRAYAKAGVSHLPAHSKRRALCRVAREHGWI
jgi:DNA-binding CsgD family transcriptional regulator